MAIGWLSVIPTFRPPSPSVELVRTLANVGPVLVSDDASPCTADRELAQMGRIPNVRVLRHFVNRGIARALNEGLAAAIAGEHRWLLTVDQDSDVDAQYATSMVEYAEQLMAWGIGVGAVGAGNVLDASGRITYPLRKSWQGEHEVSVTEEVLQSGTLWSVEALSELGGFDESMGMDAIDAAACLELRSRGLQVAVNPNATLHHQIQGAQQVSVLGRTVMVTGHSAQRRTSIVRNRLRLFPREFAQSPTHAFRTIRRSTVNVLAMPLRTRD